YSCLFYSLSRHPFYSIFFSFFLLILPPPPRSTLFPYTTLFRSPISQNAFDAVRLSKMAERNNLLRTKQLEKCVQKLARFLLPSKDRKSTRLNSSHLVISYAVFCLKKKKKKKKIKK